MIITIGFLFNTIKLVKKDHFLLSLQKFDKNPFLNADDVELLTLYTYLNVYMVLHR